MFTITPDSPDDLSSDSYLLSEEDSPTEQLADTDELPSCKLNQWIICIHAAEWSITVDEDDPFSPVSDELQIIHIPYDRKALLQAPSLSEIRSIGEDILNQVEQSIRGPCGGRKIAFVTDDWGGLILKQALLLATYNGDAYCEVKENTCILAFFGCPHRARDYDDAESLMARLLCVPDWDRKGQGFAESVQLAARELLRISREFIAIEQRYKVINVCQEDGDAMHYRVVLDGWSSRLGIAEEILIPRGRSHEDLSHFQGNTTWDRFWSSLKGSPVSEGWHLPRTCTDLYRLCSKSQAEFNLLKSPVWPQLNSGPSTQFVAHIPAVKELKNWRNSNTSNVLLLQCTTRVLTVEDIKNLLNVQDKAIWGEDTKILTTSFALNTAPDEKRFMSRLLLDYIKALARDCKKEDLVPDIFDLRAKILWTERQLWVLFRTMLATWNRGDILFIIAAADRCSSHDRWLLDELLRFEKENERTIRIAISGKDGQEFRYLNKTIHAQPVNLDAIIEQGIDEEASATLLVFLSRNPIFKTLRGDIEHKIRMNSLRSCAGLRLMLRYLEVTPHPSSIHYMRTELDKFQNLMLEEVFNVVLSQLAGGGQGWILDTLTWVTHALEPLTPDALSAALAIKTNGKSLAAWTDTVLLELVRDLTRILPHIFDIQHGYVHLSDPELHNLIRNTEGHWSVPSGRRDWFLCEQCIYFLSTEEVIARPNLDFNGIDAQQVWESFRPYAVRYWPVHYREASRQKSADHEMVLKFLKNTRAMSAWSDLYWEMEELFFKQHRAPISLRPLHLAARLGLPQIAQILLQTEVTSPDDMIADMSCAARHGHAETLQLLLDFKPSQDTVCEILSDVSNMGSDEVLQLLLQSIEIQKLPLVVFRALLNLVAENGWIKSLNYLILSPSMKDCEGDLHQSSWVAYAPLHHAVNQGHIETIESLLPHFSQADREIQFRTPLHLAAMRGHAEAVKLLPTTKRKHLYAWDEQSRTALHLAAKNGFPAVVEVLVKEDHVPSDLGDVNGSTPLTLAVAGGFLQCTSQLLPKGSITHSDHGKNTILHAAAGSRNVQIVQKLLGRRKKVTDLLDKLNTQQDRPVHVALRSRHQGVAEVLIERYRKYLRSQPDPHRGSINAESDGDLKIMYPRQSALQIAMENGLERTIPLLLQYKSVRIRDGPCSRFDLVTAAERGFACVVTDILNRQRILTHQNMEGMPSTNQGSDEPPDDIPMQVLLEALAAASSRGYLNVVEELIRLGPPCLRETPSQLRWGLKAAVDAGRAAIVRYLASVALPHARARLFSLSAEVMAASASGDVDMVHALLDNGVDVDSKDEFGNSALMLAAYHCHADIVRLLLLRKADTEMRDDSGSTAISDAAAQGSLECVKLLVEAGADVNVRTISGETPVSRAAESGQCDVVELLVRAGANVELQDGAGRDAVSKATIPQDGGDILNTILRLARPSKASLRRALIYATELLAKDAVETLLRGGATLASELWPIHVAIARGDVEMVGFLLDQGATKDEMIKGRRGTPLQLALYDQQLEVVDLLISRNVDVNYVQDPFHTALHVAAFQDTTTTGVFVRRLLKAGAFVDRKGGCWGTVLHAVLWNTSRPASTASTIARILLEENDGLRDLEDGEGRLPLHIAARLGDVETMKLVAPSTSETWLGLKDRHGRNPLHFAAMGKGVQAVQYITQTFQAEGDRVFELKDHHGWTPLHWACREGQSKIARLLMRGWSDIELPTSSGHTPRDLAIYHRKAKMLKELARDFGQLEQDDNSENLAWEYRKDILCSGCTCEIYGQVVTCKECPEYMLCFKCNLDAGLLHPHFPATGLGQ